jgi:hypothetical protein
MKKSEDGSGILPRIFRSGIEAGETPAGRAEVVQRESLLERAEGQLHTRPGATPQV